MALLLLLLLQWANWGLQLSSKEKHIDEEKRCGQRQSVSGHFVHSFGFHSLHCVGILEALSSRMASTRNIISTAGRLKQEVEVINQVA
ncbi:hypothetical protein TRIUR3_18865 [Triticum urartu]|uniref:Uncharacterized protein n=1 Tax=Triticum urartu TaxID=4572 RepID=M7ZPM5_TRIUA|nr:hypothetical protein TRIUR3_18865 [Triticum urartu]